MRRLAIAVLALAISACGSPTAPTPVTAEAAQSEGAPPTSGLGSLGASAPTSATLAPNATPSSTTRLPGEPDPRLTPGALNPNVTQAIHSTICISGWTATVRPSSSYTTELKIKQIGQYGYKVTATSACEEDHLISLELGGLRAIHATCGRSRTR